MKVVYLPVYRLAVSYMVSFGRRWSIVEHMLLLELTENRRQLPELAVIANIPERIVVEALINLLRANWVEVRSSDGIYFQATAAGKKRATEATLPPQVVRAVKWISLCVDRLTGVWMRADDLDLVYERDLPQESARLSPRIHTYHSFDGRLRELFYLNTDETLEPSEPQFRNPSQPYARVSVAFNRIESGLPTDAPLSLASAILVSAEPLPDTSSSIGEARIITSDDALYDDVGADNLIVGGAAHRDLLTVCLKEAASHVILHSCFLDPGTLEGLLPELAAAGERGVYVDLLWGLHDDPENRKAKNAISGCQEVLRRLSPVAQQRVQLSLNSSGSHAKALVWNTSNVRRQWVTAVGSCNFLSSWFNALDVSARFNSLGLAQRVIGVLLATQLPASGSWPPVARRLNNVWDRIKQQTLKSSESGSHRLRLLIDDDHYACVRQSRDDAKDTIVVGCDIFGASAETSVLVPMARAAELGRKVRLFYQRPSRQSKESGRLPDTGELEKRGISLEMISGLHGKFLFWDEERLAITSFNWLSTVPEGARVRGAELGVLIEGPALRSIFSEKMKSASNGSVC